MTAAALSDHALVINSFSKYFCMTGWRVGWMVVPEILVRPIERLQQNLSISVPSLSQIAAEAAFDGAAEMEEIKHGYQENRRILIEGLPKAGLTRFLPADGAFYLYADVSDFTSDSFEFAKQMLEQAHVAVTPGLDFDPIHGRSFIRLSYARVRLRRCGKQLTGSLTGLNSRQFSPAFWSATCLTVPSPLPPRILLSPH
ncbi:aspartate/methionine/tyrosine aminotransferase [Bradyrhizobium sp. GM5.1]